MALFELTREDLSQVINDSRFLDGVQIAVEQRFCPSEETFRGDPNLLAHLKTLAYPEYWSHVKDYSLPYISSCENPELYANKYGVDHHMTLDVIQEFNTRQMLMSQASDKLDPAWWCYIHACEVQVIFIQYSICRILFPNQQFYLYNGFSHKVLINAPINQYRRCHKDQITT